jgi:hypothetical protein
MKFTEILNEGQLSEAKPRSKGADAFGQMARSVTGDKPNTMANTPASATNTPKLGNPNVPTFGKGTAMPTKPFQVPGAGTKPTPAATSSSKPEVPATAPEKSEVPTTTSSATSPSQSVEQPSTEPTPAAGEKPGLMYKMGKGIGDFGRGFKIGYGGRMPTDADVVPDEEPASSGGTGDKSAAPVEKTTSDYARIKSNIDKLDNRSKRQLLNNLKKELGIASTPVAVTVPAKAGKDAFGAMASQLTGKPSSVPSSTGGQTTKTPTGVQHQAKPLAPATKKTGGKVPGVVSQTPNAVRKRNARAAKPIQKSSYENTGNAIVEGFSLYRKQL